MSAVNHTSQDAAAAGARTIDPVACAIDRLSGVLSDGMQAIAEALTELASATSESSRMAAIELRGGLDNQASAIHRIARAMEQNQ